MQQPKHEDVTTRIAVLTDASLPAGVLTDQLYGLAEELLADGYPRETLLEDFKRAVLKLRAEGREEAEEEVVEVLDALTGWCAPSVRL